VLIGRHRECNVRINDSTISNRHCLIYRTTKQDSIGQVTETVYIQDTSSNGTNINGVPIGRGRTKILKDGDILQLALLGCDNNTINSNDNVVVAEGSFNRDFFCTRVLGRGSFAEVRHAINRMTGREFAVKVIDRRRFPPKSRAAESIKRETSLIFGINHPFITRAYKAYEEPAFLYIVMEYIEDGELFNELVDYGAFTEDETRILFFQLFLAVKYLHDRRIAHRDLKPENVLLGKGSSSGSKIQTLSGFPNSIRPLHCKLSDFGLSRIVSNESMMQTLCGTPNYVAPEVLADGSSDRQYSLSVDMWSLGVILYVCLSGSPPFSEELAPPRMTDQIRLGRYSFPSPWWDHISDAAIDLIRGLLKVDPSERLTVREALAHPWM
ncbi:Pkinase-domain-containing protein, partial [Ramicandelaber brevisporus]